MGLRSNPSQRQRRLGEELRKLREASGLSATEAGAHARLGRAHMSHIETGRTAIPEEKLRALARVYGCASEPYVDALAAMGRANGRGWWSGYKDVLGARALDLAELESTATAQYTFEWLYVPGLLQTEDYMRALFQGWHRDAADAVVDTFVEFRRRRQDAVINNAASRIHAIVHEAALHMRFVNPTIMRHQIEHLITVSQLANVQVQILPFNATTSTEASGTPFVIFDSVVPELRTIYVEHPVSAVFLGDLTHIAQYSATFESVSAAALSPIAPCPEHASYAKTESLALLQHLLYTL